MLARAPEKAIDAPPAEAGPAADAARAVLIVDDERHVRSALGRLLRRMGLETVEAASGEEALELVAARRFGCALVDLRMPGIGGMELVRRLRGSAARLPLIVVTGHGDAEDARRCTQLGVREFVTKPWNNAELQLSVLRVLEGGPEDGPRADEVVRPETLRVGTRVADALRMGPIPPRFAPAPGVPWGDAWTEGRGGALAAVGDADADLAARLAALAQVELGRALPLASAISALGPDRAVTLLALAAVRRAYDPRPGRCEPGVERAFVHAWMRGVAMRAAAQETPGARVEPRRAFLAGLFADVGAVALVAELAAHGVLGAEALRFAADQHAAASAWIAAEWRLPGECILAAAQHHASTALYRADPLLLLLWACEEIVAQTSGAEDAAPLPHGADATKLAGMNAGIRFDVERACRAASTRFAAVLGIAPADDARCVA